MDFLNIIITALADNYTVQKKKKTDFKLRYYAVLETTGLRMVSEQVKCERAGLKGKGENDNHQET